MTSMSGPLISVLMPAYNHESYVRFAVDSVLSQTYSNLELIAIDDASRDKTWAVLSEYDDPRIRLVKHDVNQGAHSTLNEAMKMARGQYLAILDSDDIYQPERLERLLAEAERLTGNDTLIFSDVTFIDSAGETVGEHPRAVGYQTLRARCAELPAANWFLTGNSAIGTSNFFFSRALAEKVGAFTPLRYTHDWDWALRASLYQAPIWLREPLLSYRVHDANTLSEDDAWRHIHENSYIQAKALLALRHHLDMKGEPAQLARAACLALLKNESFHPLALSLYLTSSFSGVDDQELLTWTCPPEGCWFLQNLADTAQLPTDVFRTIDYLAERENAITAQKALIDERWNVIQSMNVEIGKRDECITAQTALIEEKDCCIAAQTDLIEEKDRGIAVQTVLIDERDRSLDEQSNIIDGLNQQIADQRNRLALQENELADLHSSRVVKVAIRIKKMLSNLAHLIEVNRRNPNE